MRAGDMTRLAVVTLAAAASIATPAPAVHYPRNYPAWKVESGGAAVTKCAAIETWVAKSGKEGFGLVMMFTPQTPDGCAVSLGGGRLVVDGKEILGPGCPLELRVPPGVPTYQYLPFYFDNEKLWNEGRRRGELEILVTTDGMQAATLHLKLFHHYTGPHRRVVRGDDASYQP